MLCKYVNYRCPEFFQAGTSFFIVSKITEDRQRDTQILFFFFSSGLHEFWVDELVHQTWACLVDFWTGEHLYLVGVFQYQLFMICLFVFLEKKCLWDPLFWSLSITEFLRCAQWRLLWAWGAQVRWWGSTCRDVFLECPSEPHVPCARALLIGRMVTLAEGYSLWWSCLQTGAVCVLEMCVLCSGKYLPVGKTHERQKRYGGLVLSRCRKEIWLGRAHRLRRSNKHRVEA